jgi:lysophospholipase L1-like esterase
VAVHGSRNPAGPVVILGASYAQGWKLERISEREVINRGIAGQQSFELLARFDDDVVKAAPRAVILWGFINDIFRSPAGEMEKTVARIQASYLEMIKRARAAGIEPILATEVTARPRNATVLDSVMTFVGDMAGKTSYQDQINRDVLAVNQWIVDIGAREGLTVLPFQSLLAEESGRRRRAFAQPDGSHITTAGYEQLSAYATPILEEHLRER